MFGFLGGRVIPEGFDLGPMLMKRIQLLPTTLKTRSDDYKSDLIEKMKTTYFHSSHSFKQINDKTFKMSDVAAAHAYMESDQSVGKILL